MIHNPYKYYQDLILNTLSTGVLKKPFSVFELRDEIEKTGVECDLRFLSYVLGPLVDQKILGVFFGRYIYENTEIPVLTAKEIINGR